LIILSAPEVVVANAGIRIEFDRAAAEISLLCGMDGLLLAAEFTKKASRRISNRT
jgi:hypothetical protein